MQQRCGKKVEAQRLNGGRYEFVLNYVQTEWILPKPKGRAVCTRNEIIRALSVTVHQRELTLREVFQINSFWDHRDESETSVLTAVPTERYYGVITFPENWQSRYKSRGQIDFILLLPDILRLKHKHRLTVSWSELMICAPFRSNVEIKQQSFPKMCALTFPQRQAFAPILRHIVTCT